MSSRVTLCAATQAVPAVAAASQGSGGGGVVDPVVVPPPGLPGSEVVVPLAGEVEPVVAGAEAPLLLLGFGFGELLSPLHAAIRTGTISIAESNPALLNITISSIFIGRRE
ncbi:hypothetical protein [Paraburkholderia sp. BCC1886]|uniref:hypothetical protein n=1 Tax=Paraburkholderia sp. BCC1886 TaxID=2562670 RepID=UPI0021B47657|nr:hypothetical protein [Paraburkholderia sp. BCC1886]